MKIGIDISQIVYDTGVSVYTKSLIRALSKIDNKNEYKLFAGSLRRKSDVENFLRSIKNKNFKALVYPLPPTFFNFLWNKIHIYSIENFIGELDVFHSSDWTQPPTSAKSITTVHDLTPIFYPEWSYKKIIDAHKSRLDWVKKEVDTIIVPTNATKIDLRSLGFERKNITVIPEAVEPIFKPASSIEIEKIKEKYNIEDFILCVGVSPRKNIKRCIKVFNKVKKNYPKLKLIVIGQFHEKISKVKDVIFTGHVEKKEMPVLYSGAECLLYPSLYEGFGLPILEAMACQTPVVTSDRSSMKEVAGDAAILVDADSVDDIKKGLIKALMEKSNWIKKGKKRVKDFSWEKTAKLTFAEYQKLNK
ncbi:glycosyltransferase family 4 protein [Candidatus Woesebacteria bacterium]|nr:glycosyltransferase family 4 protein [Candidatus Woesebacteria bacterium]